MTPYFSDSDLTLWNNQVPEALADKTNFFIERANGARIIALLGELKELRADGWDVIALLCPDQSVIGLGYCEARTHQLSVLS